MTRFIQNNNRKTPKKDPKPRTLPKPGQYDGKHLENAKKIISPEGGRR